MRDKITIAFGGISLESNTFAPILTDRKDFKRSDGVDDCKKELEDYLTSVGVEFVALPYFRSIPGGTLTAEAYTSMKAEFIDAIKSVGDIQGILLIQHGSMEVENLGHGDTDLVASVRDVLGSTPLISCSLDLHANLPENFVDSLDIATAYRTAPHRDRAETILRAARLLVEALKQGLRPTTSICRIPVVLSGERVITEVEPAKSLYDQLDEIGSAEAVDASLLVGFAWADRPNTGASVLLVTDCGGDSSTLKSLAEQYWNERSRFQYDVEAYEPGEALDVARSAQESTVFISDTGDNPTAGAGSDLTGLLTLLLNRAAPKTLVAGIFDPTAFDLIAAGNCTDIRLGAWLTKGYDQPCTVSGNILSEIVGDALVFRVDDTEIDVIVTRTRISFVTLQQLKNLGLNPLDYKIVAIKLGYLYPEFRDIAPRAILALTSGPSALATELLPYENLAREVYPLNKDLEWSAG